MDFKIENFIGTFDNIFSNEYCQSTAAVCSTISIVPRYLHVDLVHVPAVLQLYMYAYY